MITAVSLNPSIDRTVKVKQFVYGGMNRVTQARNDASGKAVNVAITARRLQVNAQCIGLLYKENGRIVENRLLQSDVASEFVWLDGRVRTNIKLVDESTGKVTEINEAGVPVSPDSLDKVLDLIMKNSPYDYLVLSGSLPPGCPDDFYRTIIENVEGTGCRVILDTEGTKLLQGIEAAPFLIKPNLYELEMIAGRKMTSRRDVYETAKGFLDKGVSYVIVSMGPDGAMMVNNDGALYAPALPVQVANTVGAGDAMVAGLAVGFLGDQEPDQILRMGVAAATATCMTEGTQLLEKDTYDKIVNTVDIQEI